MVADSFPVRSPKLPLFQPSLAHFAADYASASAAGAEAAAVGRPSISGVLWSLAEAIALPRIEQPNEKGGDGIFVERTLLDAFLPFNATYGVALAFVTAAANELTRTNKVNDLVTYIAGEEPDEPTLAPSLPWEWDRVGHDTATNMAKDCGSQTLTRYLEGRTKALVGSGAPYCELLKHAHKNACKEYHECRALHGTRALAASAKAARAVVASPTFYVVRAVTIWLADVAVDAVAWYRGQLSTALLGSNAALKAAKYSLSAALSLAFGAVVPFVYPNYYVFLIVEQLAANMLADTLVAKLGQIAPS